MDAEDFLTELSEYLDDAIEFARKRGPEEIRRLQWIKEWNMAARDRHVQQAKYRRVGSMTAEQRANYGRLRDSQNRRAMREARDADSRNIRRS